MVHHHCHQKNIDWDSYLGVLYADLPRTHWKLLIQCSPLKYVQHKAIFLRPAPPPLHRTLAVNVISAGLTELKLISVQAGLLSSIKQLLNEGRIHTLFSMTSISVVIFEGRLHP